MLDASMPKTPGIIFAIAMIGCGLLFHIPKCVAASASDCANSAASSQLCKDDEAFWGLDLIDAFPEWKGMLISLNGAFEGDKGTIIVRLGVSSLTGQDVKSWDVDLTRKTKIVSPKEFSAAPTSKDGEIFSNLTRDAKEGIDESEGIGIAPGALRIIFDQMKLGGDLEPCDDPVKDTYNLQQFEAANVKRITYWKSVKRILLVVEDARGGYNIGGQCGAFPKLQEKPFANFASTDSGSLLFRMHDGTAIIQVGHGVGAPALILRLDQHLQVKFSSKKFILVDATDYENYVDAKGVFSVQERLLSILNAKAK